MDEINDKFYYVYSSSLEQNVQIKIGTLEGKLKKPEYDKLLADPMLKFSGLYQEKCSDLMVVCQVYADNRSFGLPVSTSYKAFTTRWNWNEWITLPIQYCDLPRSAQLALTIYDCEGPNNVLPVGGTTITLFGKHGVFRQGMLDLRVWPNRKADGSVCTCTPGKSRDNEKEQMQRLAKITKRHRNGHITKVDWLDRLTFREVELIHQKEKQNSNYLYLMIEFPEVCIDDVPHAVVYYEPDGDEVYQFRAQADVVTVPDHEILQENLVESKHHKLARSLRSGVSDKDLKPNATVRDMLNNIVAYPPTKQLSNEEQDLVWKFRFYLSNQKKALAKFLKCVNWKVTGEARQALAMLQQWAPMDVEDALELLGPNFNHFAVRRYAVSRLKQAPDEDLLLYLLQLVQALKYENFEEIKEGYKKLSIQDCELVNDETEKTKDLIQENVLVDSNEELTLRHSLSCDAPVSNEVGGSLKVHATQRVENLTYSLQNFPGMNTETVSSECSDNDGFCDLASFLIYRACKNATLANYFYWYLLIECEDQETAQTKQDSKVREMYLTVMRTFSQTLARGSAEWQNRRFLLTKQQNFLDKLVLVIKAVNSSKDGSTKKKTEILQHLLQHGSEDTKMSFANFDPIPFPLDPDIYIKGIIPSKASLYRSALQPSRLTFVTAESEEYVAIFKYGDDLRQDQLVLQIITLMDKLLRRENLDLKLTPYKVLATGTKHGFVQCIDSKNVAMVLTQDGSIQNYFRKFYPSETGPYGIIPEVMDTYVRSCAGYCVITYLLGVGDRHLDNLLLTTNGKLFHIDFGYILGRDPKPLPPPMKLSKEMVDGMGGINSEHYHELRKQCYTAFLHLRRHANLILNLFSLMVDASCPDIALEPDKAVRKVQDNLQLHLSDEEAVHYMQNLLDESVTAVMPALVEQFHKFAQYWRK